MRAQLVHLSGPMRGLTVTYDGPNTLIGTDPDAAVQYRAVGAVEPRHAEIAFVKDGCAFYLRPIEGRVFVNRREVEEVALENDDLLEFGIDGPRAKFRVHVDPGRVCKPVRTMLRDAADVGRASGAFAFTGSFVRDLVRHSTARFKIGVLLFALMLVGVAFGAGWLGGGRSSRVAIAAEVEAMRRQLAELQAMHEFSAAEVTRLRAELAARGEALDLLRADDAAVGRVHDVYARGVCLVHGRYGFRLPGPDGDVLTDAAGAPVSIEYTGSGFRVTGEGHIVTNRHVVRPWEFDPEVAALLRLGAEPYLLGLTVTFPGRDPVAIDAATVRVRSDRVDVASMRTDLDEEVPVLPLSEAAPADLRGSRVLVVGYPAGVNALLAKADERVARAVIDGMPPLDEIIRRLATHGAITPLITSGTLGDAGAEKLVYDAETTSGGSGGPVFDRAGAVIGVNFAVMREFGGSNFGVPIRFVRELLPH